MVITILAMNKPNQDYVFNYLYRAKYMGVNEQNWYGRKRFNFVVLDVWQVGDLKFIGFMNELY